MASSDAARRGTAPVTGTAITGLSRLIFNLRLFAVSLTLVYIPQWDGELAALLAGLLVTGALSVIALVWWERIGPFVARHPSLLAADLFFAMGVLAVVGERSPFFYFTLGTALLAGVLYEVFGAAVFTFLLLAGYWAGLAIRVQVAPPADAFQATIGLPALYPVSAAAGVWLRRLFDRQARAETAAGEAKTAAAVEAERARLAREMHDSVAKTLQGLSLSAAALPGWMAKDPARAAAESRALAQAAARAAAEARSLITDLRSDSLDVPLGDAVRNYVSEWSKRTGVRAEVKTDAAPNTTPSTRWELFSILREALTNVEHHAGARRVEIELADLGETVSLRVTDDGVGFSPPADLGSFQQDGRFGLLGMTERAREVGGRLEVSSAPGRGCTVTVTMPAQQAHRPGDPVAAEVGA